MGTDKDRHIFVSMLLLQSFSTLYLFTLMVSALATIARKKGGENKTCKLHVLLTFRVLALPELGRAIYSQRD